MKIRIWSTLALAVLVGACEAGPPFTDRTDAEPPAAAAGEGSAPDSSAAVDSASTGDGAALASREDASDGSGAAGTTRGAASDGAPSVSARPPSGSAAPSSGSSSAPQPPARRPGQPAPDAVVGADYEPWSGPSDEPPLTFERPEHIRGVYLNAWTAGSSRRTAALIDLAERTEVNTFVIDIKDATGYLSHDSRVPLAREIGATGQLRVRDLPGLLRRLHEADIYPVARIVIVKDPILIAHRPDWAIQDTAGGVWVDGKDFVWLNMYDRRVWEYHLDLAREMASLGFPEIQWDYVRFPDAPRAEILRASYPGRDGRERTDAIRGFLGFTRDALEPLGVRVTADVFGVTTSAGNDVGIGQVWETFIDRVDAALPMVYPSHYWRGSFGIQSPNAHPYEIIAAALRPALRRSKGVDGAGTIIPWLQDFTLGPPAYGAPEVRAQIQATYDVGIQDWILWNPSSRYSEDALEPVGGWKTPPMMRLAGHIVPVHRRTAFLDSIARARRVADSLDALPDSLKPRPAPLDTMRITPPTPRADTLRPDTLHLDTLRGDTIRVDTIRADTVRPDTVGAPRH